MVEALRYNGNVVETARSQAEQLKSDQDVTMVWDRLDGDGTHHIIAQRRDGTAERFSFQPDGSSEHTRGTIKHTRADRGHRTRLSQFIPSEGNPTELDRREF